MELARWSSVWLKPQVMRLTSLATRLLGSTSAGLSLGPAWALAAPQKAESAAALLKRARRERRSWLMPALRSCWTWLKVALLAGDLCRAGAGCGGPGLPSLPEDPTFASKIG